MSQALSAPGKLFLAGEYAVLEPGRLALVAAVLPALGAEWEPAGSYELVNRPAAARTADLDHPPDALRFAARGVRIARRFCAELGKAERPFRLTFLDALELDGVKLGLGGSAAATVLAVRATLAAHGVPPGPGAELALAVAAHWAEQGGAGSGGDIAASATGGLVQVRSRIPWRAAAELEALPARAIAAVAPVEVERLEVPEDLRLALVATGIAADTRRLIREVKLFAAGARTRWLFHADALEDCALALRDGLRAAAATSDPAPREAALAAVRRAAAAMAALGEEVGAPILVPGLVRAAALASAAGCAAKPSGAGGGDSAVLLAFGDAALERAKQAFARELSVRRVSLAP